MWQIKLWSCFVSLCAWRYGRTNFIGGLHRLSRQILQTMKRVRLIYITLPESPHSILILVGFSACKTDWHRLEQSFPSLSSSTFRVQAIIHSSELHYKRHLYMADLDILGQIAHDDSMHVQIQAVQTYISQPTLRSRSCLIVYTCLRV